MRRPEQRLHPIVRRLLTEEPGSRSPEDAILLRVNRAIVLARSLGWRGPPFDIEELASILRLRVEYTDKLPSGQSGAIVEGTPVKILVAASDPKMRQRYTIAHEIAHTLLPGPFEGLESVAWTYRMDSQSPIETLCQIAASEFLMPTEIAQRFVEGASLLGSMLRIRDSFEVSNEAAARKVVALIPQPAAGLLLRETNKPSENRDASQQSLFGEMDLRPPPKVRVGYAFASARGPFIPGHKSIPEISRVHALVGADQGSSICVIENWSGCFGWDKTQVEAVRLAEQGRAFEALCLITPAEA